MPGTQAFVVADLKGAIQRLRIIAAVIDVSAGGSVVRELLRLDHVPPADLRGVDVQVTRQHVHGALDQIDALRSTVSAVRALRGVVCIDGVDFKRGLSNGVDAGGDDGGRLRDDGGCALGERAEIRGVPETERLDATINGRRLLRTQRSCRGRG